MRQKGLVFAVGLAIALVLSVCNVNAAPPASCCDATVNTSTLTLTVPLISFAGKFYEADLVLDATKTTDGGTWFYVSKLAATTEHCSTPASIEMHKDGMYKLYMPVVRLMGASYYVYLQHRPEETTGGKAWLKLTPYVGVY